MSWLNRDYDMIKGKYGPRMILTDAWNNKMLSVISKKKVLELELNPAKGWKRGSLDFLSELSRLVAFEIVDEKTKDVYPMHNLSKLRYLKVLTYCNTPIDFTCYPELEEISLEWREKASSLYDCTTLKKVFINNCTAKSLKAFGRLNLLEHLSLKSPRLDMIGDVTSLKRLKFLGIYNAKNLNSLEGIEQFENLQMLEIDTCRKITDIEPIQTLTKLKRLMIANCGEIASLKPVIELKQLEDLFFHESTKIMDGDLAILKELPRLEDTSFQERRHYNCKWEDLPMRCSKKELQKARELLRRG